MHHNCKIMRLNSFFALNNCVKLIFGVNCQRTVMHSTVDAEAVINKIETRQYSYIY